MALRKISEEELKEILYQHKKWLDSDGKEGEKADLSRADLKKANLTIAILSRASLELATLSEADLLFANLSVAILTRTDLSGANLSGATLYKADFSKAKLRDANLSKAILLFAIFSGADLGNANFEKTFVSRIKYDRKGCYRGISVDSCYGSPRFKRFAEDQDYLEELRGGKWWEKIYYYLWLISADCGRTMWLWIGWCASFVFCFGKIFFLMAPNAFAVDDLPWKLSTLMYYSVVTFTTLGFGDITPKTTGAALLVMLEVILGYVMLGGLISIFATKLARRS